MELLNTLFLDPFLNVLIFLYQVLGHDMGLAIIALTIIFKVITLPLNLRMLRSQRRMQQLRPKLEKLKEQHGDDRMALAQAQMDLYKSEGVSPAGSCLPLLLQLPFLIGLFAAFRLVVDAKNVDELNSHLYSESMYFNSLADLDLQFFWTNLASPDQLFILPVLAAVSQFVLTKMMTPNLPKRKKQDNAQASLEDSLAAAQGQMVYLFPIITFFINLTFPAGLALYWTAGNIFSIIQQFYINAQFSSTVTDNLGIIEPAEEMIDASADTKQDTGAAAESKKKSSKTKSKTKKSKKKK